MLHIIITFIVGVVCGAGVMCLMFVSSKSDDFSDGYNAGYTRCRNDYINENIERK